MEHAQSLELANKGRVAHMLSQQLEPYMKKIEHELIESMKNLYRDDSKEVSKSVLLAKLAGLCVVEDIRNKLTSDINQGGIAHKEIL